MFSTRHLDSDAVASTGTGMLQKYVPSAAGMSQGTPAATIFPFESATQASTSPMTAARSRRLGTDVFPTTTTVVPTRRHLRGDVVNPFQSMCEVEGDGTRRTARCGVGSVDPHPAIPASTMRLTRANGSRSALRRDLTRPASMDTLAHGPLIGDGRNATSEGRKEREHGGVDFHASPTHTTEHQI
jgi:hypothetical protein